MRSETPESVRLTVNVKLHGGSCAAVKKSQRIKGGGAGRERVPIESEEKILHFASCRGQAPYSRLIPNFG